jgi:hypothetical protein
MEKIDNQMQRFSSPQFNHLQKQRKSDSLLIWRNEEEEIGALSSELFAFLLESIVIN